MLTDLQRMALPGGDATHDELRDCLARMALENAELRRMNEYKGMFEDAVRTLAAIDDALGLPEDCCNGPSTTLAKIRELRDETSGRWISVHERRPMTDDETPYLGMNSQGFVGCFNHLFGTRGADGGPVLNWHCIYLTAEEQIDVLDGMEYWMPIPMTPNVELRGASDDATTK